MNIQSEKVAAFTSTLSPTALAFPKEVLAKAQHVLGGIDFPTTRTEAWKYTRVAKIANLTLKAASSTNPKSGESTFVFENGQLTELNSKLPEGISVKLLSQCTTAELEELGSQLPLEGEIFNCINTFYATDGLFIHIKANSTIENPIEIVHLINEGKFISNVRNYIVIEKNAKASITISYPEQNATGSFLNAVNEVFVGENSNLCIDKLQNEAEGNFHIETDQVQQAANSVFTINTITLGGSFVRNNLNIKVAGKNCETHLNGAYVLKGNQHVDNHTCVDHLEAHCVSNELYKGVISDQATAVFNGKVFVRKDAQKVNAYQSNANILLSDNATINSKPELEIYADDVKCSHGSTTGQMDEQAIFYLRARGLSEKSAKQLLVSAFIEDALATISSEKMAKQIHTILQEKFGWE